MKQSIQDPRGFTVTWRRLFEEWGWSGDPLMVALFLRLINDANHRETEFKGSVIQRGQVVFGLNAWSKKTGISVRSLRTCLSRLEAGGEITRKTTNKYSIITVCNYCKWQDDHTEQRQASDKPATSQRQRLNNVNNETSIKNTVRKQTSYTDDFETFWKKYPRGENKKKAFDIWKRRNLENGLFSEVMEGLDRWCKSNQWQSGIIPHATTWLNGQRWDDEIQDRPTTGQDMKQVDYI